jgi:hypothetical protein
MNKIKWLAMFLLTVPVTAQGANCGELRNAYQGLYKQTQIANPEQAKIVTPQSLEISRLKMSSIVEGAIRVSLGGNDHVSISKVREDIQCVQVPARAEEENPNLPYVIEIKGETVSDFLIAYVISAGGDGIPDSMPFVALWSHISGVWKPQYIKTDFYRRSSFSLDALKTPPDSARYFMASGKEYGDNLSRLKLVTLKVNNHQLQQIGQMFDFPAGSVETIGDRILVSYMESRQTGARKEIAFVVRDGALQQLK